MAGPRIAAVAATVDTPEPAGTDTFQVVDIPDTVVSGGFFIAGFMDGTDGPFPAKLDNTASMGQSYFAEHSMNGGLDIMDPFGSATLFGLVDNVGFPGNWLLRAESPQKKDCMIGDVNMDGDINLLDVDFFVAAVKAGDFLCEADCNEDGEVNLLDVDFFVAILQGGGG